jgi:hypothetical protein
MDSWDMNKGDCGGSFRIHSGISTWSILTIPVGGRGVI